MEQPAETPGPTRNPRNAGRGSSAGSCRTTYRKMIQFGLVVPSKKCTFASENFCKSGINLRQKTNTNNHVMIFNKPSIFVNLNI